MRRKSFLLICKLIIFNLSILILFSYPTELKAFEITAQSCSYEHIQEAIEVAEANGGGIIYIPEGYCDLNSQTIKISDRISLIGAGQDKTIFNNTIIRIGGTYSNSFRISGFAIDTGFIEVRKCKDFRLDHLTTDTYSGTAIIILESNSGVIDHCKIRVHGHYYGILVSQGYNVFYPEDWESNTSNLLGKPTAIFIEDCEFNGCQHAIVGHANAHYVARYNIFENHNAHPIDAHGPGYGPPCGTRLIEVYKNIFNISPEYTWKAVGLRGGSAVIFENEFNDYDNAVLLCLERDSNGPYPIAMQVHDVWIWGNSFNNLGYPIYRCPCGWENGSSHCCEVLVWDINMHPGVVSKDYIKLDRDYFFRKPTQELDGFTYTPYPYPHPLVAGGEADNTAPSAIANLSISELTSSSVTLSWTAPGDDGTTGTASKYDIRYLTSSITKTNWDSADQAIGEQIPSSAGTEESYVLTGLFPNTTYYVCIKTSDELYNISSLSNIVSTTTLEDVKGNTYFVSKNGNDSNPGSESQPWFSIQRAANTLQAGDIVYIKEGTYIEKVITQNSGMTDSYITYAAYPGHKVILDGTGNEGWHGVFSIYGQDYIKIKGLEIMNNSIGWGVLIQHDTSDVNNSATYIELFELEVHHTGGEAIQVRGNTNNILINKCIVHDADNPSGIDIYQWSGGRPHHVRVRECTAYNYPDFAGIASEQADNLIIENNICYSNELGIDIGSGDNNIIRNNKVYDCNTGIALSSNEDSRIYNNIIYNIYDEAIYSYYWVAHGEAHARNKWYDNIIYNAGFGIYESIRKNASYDTGPSTDHEFYNNLFYNIGTHGTYRVPFYFQGSTGIRFYNNNIYMNGNYDALQFIDGANSAEIKNNIISISGDNFALRVEDTSYVAANIDYNCYENRSGTNIILWNDDTSVTSYTNSQINDKTFYTKTGQGEHSIATDPKFVDPVTDFNLQEGSLCIDAGDPTYSVPPGGGVRIDMGAFEYGATTNPLPSPKEFRIISIN